MDSNIITITGGSIIKCRVAAVTEHPHNGVIVSIEGNPNGLLRTSLITGATLVEKTERRNFLIANAGEVEIEVMVAEAHYLPNDAVKGHPAYGLPLVPRIVVDEEGADFARSLEAGQ